MADDNLPKDRMILVKGIDPEDNVLLNVDDIAAVRRYNERPMIYIGQQPQPYGRGLTITLQSGAVYRVETEMTLREFEIERAKKFTPVPEEKPLVAVQPPMDEGWEEVSFSTEWLYYRPLNGDWVEATDMGQAIEMSQILGSKSKAVIRRIQEKEFPPDGLY